MNCEQASILISARIDGETIAPGDASALDAHLSTCAGCREAEQALRVQDAQLLRAFGPHRRSAEHVARNIATRIAAERGSFVGRAWWLAPLMAAAAGFMLAVVLFRPWERRAPQVVIENPVGPVTPSTGPSEAAPVATLQLATGLVEVRPAGATEWQAMSTGGIVRQDDMVRTGPKVRCEFLCPDGSQVRLNSQTELHFRDRRLLDLSTGQLWSTVAKADDPFQVKVPDATVTALGTQFDLSCKGPESVLTVVEGSTRVDDKSGQRVVKSGESLKIVDGRSEDPKRVHNLVLATRWVHDVLLLKGPGNDELSNRINDLFAQIGHEKMAFFYEEEIRSLGHHCVVPLSRYIQSDRSSGEDEKRQTAAKILADVAQPWSAGELINLLDDRDGIVRYHAARALYRVTGEEQGRSPEQWRDENPRDGVAALKKWRDWWEENKQRIPGAP